MGLRTDILGMLGIGLLVIGTVVGITLMALDPKSAIRRNWDKYIALLDKEVRFLFLPTKATTIARNQLIGVGLLLVAGFFLQEELFLGLVPLVGIVPIYLLRRRRQERIDKLELQLDSWLLLLSNALKATPSLGEAIRNSARIIREPISQELDLLLKEVDLGTPLDVAVLSMSERVGSRIVSGSLAAILVGRQTGGDLPRILEESAATLREMQRLEGVVRTKTAEGKSQAMVLGFVPFFLIGAIHFIDPNWLVPLTETTLGYLIIAIAMTMWIGAILAARKILAVDI